MISINSAHLGDVEGLWYRETLCSILPYRSLTVTPTSFKRYQVLVGIRTDFDERGALKCVKALATLQACWIRLKQAQLNIACAKQLSVQCHKGKLCVLGWVAAG
jgi:hypothetical protein